MFQGGSSIELTPSSSLQGRIENILDGFRFSTDDEWVELTFTPIRYDGQMNITPNIKRKSSDKLSAVLIKGSIFIIKTS